MINENTYLSRIIDTFSFINDMEAKVDRNYVYEKSISAGNGVKEIIQDPKLWLNNSVPSDETVQKMVDIVSKKQFAKVNNYKKWILGYGLVMLCAIFDDFLINLLDEILVVNPQFTSWYSKEEILARFMQETIKGKYNLFITKLNFKDTEFFDFSIFVPSVRIKFKDTDIIKLNELYKKRNKAAHSDGYVISDINELSEIREFFEKMIWNLSIKCRRKWNIKSELIEIIKSQTPTQAQQ